MAISRQHSSKRTVKPTPPTEQPITFHADEEETIYANNNEKGAASFLGDPLYKESKNWATRGRITAFAVCGLLAACVASAIIHPYTLPKTLSDAEFAAKARAANGETGFNKAAGEEIAVNYVKAYLSLKTDETAEKQLAFYLTGDSLSSASDNNGASNIRSSTANSAQQVIGTPQVTRVAVHKNSALATYRVVALVKPSATGTGTTVKDAAKNNNQNAELKQISMSVTVAYNEKTSKYYVATPHPAIVPSLSMGKAQELVKSKTIPGERVQPSADLDSVIQGYFKAYVAATPEKPGDLSQYVVDIKKSSVATIGFGGQYTVNTNSITYEAYRQSNGDIIAKVNLELVDELGGSTDTDTKESAKQSITYPVTYKVTLSQQPNKKFLVSNMEPDIYDTDSSDIVRTVSTGE